MKGNDSLTGSDFRQLATVYWDVVIPTAERRNTWLLKFDRSRTPEKDSITGLVVHAPLISRYKETYEQAGILINDLNQQNTGNPELFKKNLFYIEKSIILVYYLALLYELDGIQEYRGSNLAKAEEKVVEARLFFNICKDVEYQVKGRNQSQLTMDFLSELKKPVNDINISLCCRYLTELFLYFYAGGF